MPNYQRGLTISLKVRNSQLLTINESRKDIRLICRKDIPYNALRIWDIN